MKIRYKLWLIFSLLFIFMSASIYFFIVQAYKERILIGQEQLSLSLGTSMAERLTGTYPKFPERTLGYLEDYGKRHQLRLLIIQPNDRSIEYDSFNQLNRGTVLDLEILNEAGEKPVSQFIPTSNYGYVQHTLIPIYPTQPQSSQLLMIGDVNAVYEDILSFQTWVLQIIGIALAVFFLLSFWISGWFSKPMAEMIAHMKQISPQHRQFKMVYRRQDEIKELVQAITEMVDQLHQYEQNQKQFLSASSHELKTPLATMQLIAENLAYVGQDESQHQEFIDDLFSQINKMKQMVEELLHLSRIWNHPIQLQPLEVASIQKHLTQQFQRLADQKGMTLLFKLSPYPLVVDHELFFRGIDNLLSNAIRYSPEQTTITISLSKIAADQLLFSVCDQGIGIDQEDIPYLFEPFYRSKEASEFNQEGTGLGLTIVKQVMEKHRGRVQIQSVRGQGTCFQLFFITKLLQSDNLLDTQKS